MNSSGKIQGKKKKRKEKQHDERTPRKWEKHRGNVKKTRGKSASEKTRGKNASGKNTRKKRKRKKHTEKAQAKKNTRKKAEETQAKKQRCSHVHTIDFDFLICLTRTDNRHMVRQFTHTGLTTLRTRENTGRVRERSRDNRREGDYRPSTSMINRWRS